MMKKSPGPASTWNRPSRRTITRSHWLATLTALARIEATMKATTAIAMLVAQSPPLALGEAMSSPRPKRMTNTSPGSAFVCGMGTLPARTGLSCTVDPPQAAPEYGAFAERRQHYRRARLDEVLANEW